MGTYRVEWPCCGSATETEAWEPEQCPFCEPDNAANAPADPALLALAKLAAKLFDRAWIKSVGFVNEGGIQDDLDRDTVAFGLVRYEAPGDFQMAPGIADAIAALLAPDGAGEVADG